MANVPPMRIGALARSGLTNALVESFNGYVGMMRCSITPAGWALDYACEQGPGESLGICDRFSLYLNSAPIKWTLWNPLNVAAEDRNRAKIIDNRVFRDVHIVRNLYAPAGLDRLSHLTLVATRGPHLIAWLGVWREQPFSRRDEVLLNEYNNEIRERLAVADVLGGAEVTWCLVEAALEALDQPAFLLSPSGQVQLVNQAGITLLQRGRRSLMARLLKAMQVDDPNWRVTPIGDTGMPKMVLLVFRPSSRESTFDARVGWAQQAWTLTTTQRAVLSMLARGLSNKEMANASGRAERTIELHVSAILQRAKVDSRTRLMARFWDWYHEGE